LKRRNLRIKRLIRKRKRKRMKRWKRFDNKLKFKERKSKL